LWVMKKSAMAAPKSNTNWGYVFDNCTVDGTLDGFDLGRSWGDARMVMLNTTMKQLPSDRGWGDPMNSVPKVFAEFGSTNGSGTPIDLSNRRTSYTKDSTTVQLNPVLSASEAAQYTMDNVLTGWNPRQYTKQVAAPIIRLNGQSITWDDAPNARCLAVFVNGRFVADITDNSYDISALSSGDVVTVRAANQMGGLGPRSNALEM